MASLGNIHRPSCCLPPDKTQALKWFPQRSGHQTLVKPQHVAGFGGIETNPIGILPLRCGQAGRGNVGFALSHPQVSTGARGEGCTQLGNRRKPLGLHRDRAAAFSSTHRARQPGCHQSSLGCFYKCSSKLPFRALLAILTANQEPEMGEGWEKG